MLAVRERVFLGWDRPVLRAVAASILQRRFGPEAIVVVPGSRAGRRLSELLAGGADAPPRVMTIGEMMNELTAAEGEPAPPPVRVCAWAQVLSSLPPPGRVLLTPAGGESWESRLALARRVAGLSDELAFEGLFFDDALRVAARCSWEQAPGVWAALARAQEMYREALGRRGLFDPAIAALETARGGDAAEAPMIVTAGVVEIPGVARRLLEKAAGGVTALVAAPEELAHGFDELGCLRAKVWEEMEIPIPAASVRVVAGPVEQARAVVAEIDRLAAEHRVVVGVPDAALAPFIEHAAEHAGGIACRDASGTPARRSALAGLLELAADLVERRRFDALAAFVRHPGVEEFLRRRWHDRREPMPDWPSLLDRYHAQTLHDRLDGRWWTPEAGLRSHLAALWEELGGLLDLEQRQRWIGDWAGAIAEILDAAGPRGPDPVRASAARGAVDDVLGGLAKIDRGVRVTLGQTLRFVLGQLEPIVLPPPGGAPPGKAVEMVGWLELALEGADAVIVTGMNEGVVPAPMGVDDPWLAGELRRRLGLPARAQRPARDAYAALAILHAHRHAVFIAAALGTQGEPMLPSRLLMRVPTAELPERVAFLLRVGEPGAAPPPRSACGKESKFIVPIPPTEATIGKMGVTWFGEYLRSPYGFYLRRVLGLRSIDDTARELDASALGTLLHDALTAWARGDGWAGDNPRQIQSALQDHLSALARRRLGEAPPVAVALQLAQLRVRLERLAHLQAQRYRQGWRIYAAEWEPDPEGATLDVDGTPMPLAGRIDRIDRHEDGRWQILDYKSGDRPLPPQRTHRRGDSWRDLQLPLYAHLARGVCGERNIGLGYIALQAAGEARELLAPWGEHELGGALEAARGVVRAVREGRFSELGGEPPDRGVLAVLCGMPGGRP